MTILEILMRRDSMTMEEAKILINHAKIALNNYLLENNTEAAANVCEEYFGLEADYLFELL